MSRIKANADQIKRTPSNTTIRADLLEKFKSYAKSMSMIDRRFVLTIGKNSKIEVDVKIEIDVKE